MKEITTAKIKELLDANKGKIFSVDFIKGMTTRNAVARPRHMTCREGVVKYVKGTGTGFVKVDPADYLKVYDMVAKGYRTIIIDTIFRIKVAGTTYNVKG